MSIFQILFQTLFQRTNNSVITIFQNVCRHSQFTIMKSFFEQKNDEDKFKL